MAIAVACLEFLGGENAFGFRWCSSVQPSGILQYVPPEGRAGRLAFVPPRPHVGQETFYVCSHDILTRIVSLGYTL